MASWIRTDERLPPCNSFVVVYYAKPWNYCTIYKTPSQWAFAKGGPETRMFSHWLEIPELPNE